MAKTAANLKTKTEYFSESRQDQWLYENVFRDKREGIYVEAGALDGLLHSNTLFFERELAWTGLLVEANPMFLGPLTQNRSDNVIIGCALASELGVAPFEIFTQAPIGWSGLRHTFTEKRAEDIFSKVGGGGRQTVHVQTRTLISVLRESFVGAVDLLSLDVEGAEYDVLMDYPFDEIPIDVIMVEDNYRDDTRTANLLKANGYEHLARVGNDEIWRRK